MNGWMQKQCKKVRYMPKFQSYREIGSTHEFEVAELLNSYFLMVGRKNIE